MIPLSRTTHILWTIRNGTVEVDGEVDGEEDGKRAGFLVFVGRFVPMQVFIHVC